MNMSELKTMKHVLAGMKIAREEISVYGTVVDAQGNAVSRLGTQAKVLVGRYGRDEALSLLDKAIERQTARLHDFALSEVYGL